MDVVMPELQTSFAISVFSTNLGGDLPDSDEPPLKSINAKYMCSIFIIITASISSIKRPYKLYSSAFGLEPNHVQENMIPRLSLAH